MPSIPPFLLGIISPLIEQLLKDAVTSADAKAVLVTILQQLEALIATEEAKVTGVFAPLAQDAAAALDSALNGVIAALQA
jgi:hypothetical protein